MFEQVPALATPANAAAVEAVDLDGDGLREIVVNAGSSSSGTTALLRNTRYAATASGSATGTLARPIAVFADGFE